MARKLCPKCGKKKSLSKFYNDKIKKDKVTSWCKECILKKRKDNYNYDKIYSRKINLKKNYGLTLEQYDRIFEQQDGVCKICKRSELNCRLSVDHNHETGRIRGLLCRSCNARLGVLEDDNFLLKAKEYLRG